MEFDGRITKSSLEIKNYPEHAELTITTVVTIPKEGLDQAGMFWSAGRLYRRIVAHLTPA